MAVRLIGPDDPDYLEKFYKAWGSGQSFTSRQAMSFQKKEPRPAKQKLQGGQQEADPSRPSHGRLEDDHLASRESTED